MGLSRHRAAAVIGCSPATIGYALSRDPDFAADMRRAEVQQEVALLKRVEDASKVLVHWRAAAWLLERRHPDRYGRRRPGTMTPEQVATVVAQFAEILKRGIRNSDDRRRVGTDLKLLTNALADRAAGDPS